MNPGRTSFTFSVMGMAAREAMLLKSFVRILDSRTKQRWIFKAQPDAGEQQAADLIFLGDEGEAVDASDIAAPGPRPLRLGLLALDTYTKLDRPLRPDELERKLNRMGKLLVVARMQSANNFNLGIHSGVGDNAYAASSQPESVNDAKPLYLWQLPVNGSTHSEFVPTDKSGVAFAGTAVATLPKSTLVDAPVAAAQPVKEIKKDVIVTIMTQVASTDRLHMLRWPHANLINTPLRLKLAAFIASGSNSIESLQRTSGQPMPDCAAFVQDLHASGFLSVTPIVLPAADNVALHRHSPAYPTAASPSSLLKVESAKTQPVPARSSGLFARIRARLGISLAG